MPKRRIEGRTRMRPSRGTKASSFAVAKPSVYTGMGQIKLVYGFLKQESSIRKKTHDSKQTNRDNAKDKKKSSNPADTMDSGKIWMRKRIRQPLTKMVVEQLYLKVPLELRKFTQKDDPAGFIQWVAKKKFGELTPQNFEKVRAEAIRLVDIVDARIVRIMNANKEGRAIKKNVDPIIQQNAIDSFGHIIMAETMELIKTDLEMAKF